MNSEPAEENRGIMSFKGLVSLPTDAAHKHPLSYEEDFREAVKTARHKLAALHVDLLARDYNAAQPDMSFADYLVDVVKTLDVHESLRLNADGLQVMDVNDEVLGIYIEARLKDLARMLDQPDLARVKLTTGGYATALRFFKR